MAGAKVRGITIELSADASGVSKALQTVNKNISSTSKELRDIDKLLKLDPTNVTLLAQKHEALQRQITNTRDKLDLLKKAEEDLQKEMKDGGTEEQKKQLAALQREIISTEKDLDKYTDQLDETGKETDQLTQAEKKAEDATGKLSGGFTVLKGALANLVADGLRKAVDGFKDIMTAAPKFADDILELSSKTHLATDTLQELSYMSGMIDVDVSTVAKSMTKLTKSMASAQGGTGAAANAFQSLGISVTDANGHLRKSEDVFFDVIDALGGIENEAERDAVSMSLFGKSATELNPMIEAGSDALKGFADEAHEMGYVLDKDALDALGRVQDEFDRFQRQMESVKNQIGAGVAPAIERGMRRIQQTVSKIDWTKIGRQIGKAFDGLIDAFEWIISHGNEIKAILSGVVAALAVNKIASFVTALSGMVNGLKAATTAQKGLNAAANANPYILLASAVAACVAAFISLEQSSWNSYKATDAEWQKVNELTDAIDTHSEAIYSAVSAYDEMNTARQQTLDAGMAEIDHVQSLKNELANLADENGNVAESDRTRAEFILGELNNALGTEYTMTGNVIDQYVDLTSAIDALIEKKKAELILQAEENAYREAIINRADAERNLEAIEQDRINTENALSDVTKRKNEILSMSSDEVAKHQFELSQLDAKELQLRNSLNKTNDAYNEARDLVGRYTHDIVQYEDNMQKSLEGNYDAIQHKSWETAKAEEKAAKDASVAVVKATEEGTKNWKQTMENTAANIPAGVASGIANNTWRAVNAAANMALQATAAFNNNMGIKSPSRVMMKSAKFMVEGVAEGIKDNEGIAIGAVEDFSDELTAAMNPSASFSSMINGGRVAATGMTSEAGILNLLAKYLPELVNRDVTLDGDTIVGKLAPKYNKQFGKMETMSARGV